MLAVLTVSATAENLWSHNYMVSTELLDTSFVS